MREKNVNNYNETIPELSQSPIMKLMDRLDSEDD